MIKNKKTQFIFLVILLVIIVLPINHVLAVSWMSFPPTVPGPIKPQNSDDSNAIVWEKSHLTVCAKSHLPELEKFRVTERVKQIVERLPKKPMSS